MADLWVALVAGVTLAFVSIVGLAVARAWLASGRPAVEREVEARYRLDLERTAQQLEKAANAAHNWKARFRRLQRGDLEPDDDDDLLEEDDDRAPSDEGKLSDLAKLVVPKLPPSISKIIDAPAFAEVLAKSVEKNPDGVAALIDRFTKKPQPAAEAPAAGDPGAIPLANRAGWI